MPEYIEKETAVAGLRVRAANIRIECPADAAEYLQGIPAADVAPVVHAHWEPKLARYGPDGWICTNPKCGVLSCCKGTFCPNCGAKMDEEGKS